MISFLTSKMGPIAAGITAIMAAILGVYVKGRVDGSRSSYNKAGKAVKKLQGNLDRRYEERRKSFDKVRDDLLRKYPDERVR